MSLAEIKESPLYNKVTKKTMTPTPAPSSPPPVSQSKTPSPIQRAQKQIERETPPPKKELTTIETVRQGAEEDVNSLSQSKIKILLSPGYSKFTDSSGKTYTKNEAIGAISKEQASAGRNLATIRDLESKNYQVRETAPGTFEFYKTAEQVREEGIVQKEKDLLAAPVVPAILAWGTSGALSWEDPFNIKSTAQLILGDSKGALRTKATAMYDLDQALHSTQTSLAKGTLNLARGDILGAGVNYAESGDYSITVLTGPLATVGFSFVG